MSNKSLVFKQEGETAEFSVYSKYRYLGYIILETNTSFIDTPNIPPFSFRTKGDPFLWLDQINEIQQKLHELTFDERIQPRKTPMQYLYENYEKEEVPIVEINGDVVIWDAGEWTNTVPPQPKYIISDRSKFGELNV